MEESPELGRVNVRRFLPNRARNTLRSVANFTGVGKYIPRGQDRLYREYLTIVQKEKRNISFSDIDQIITLFNQGLNPDTVQPLQPLLFAIWMYNFEFLRFLLRIYDPNVVDTSTPSADIQERFPYLGQRYTPLLYAIRLGSYSFIEDLLNYEASPNFGNGETFPLLLAIDLDKYNASPNPIYAEEILLHNDKEREKVLQHQREKQGRGWFGRAVNALLGDYTAEPFGIYGEHIVEKLLENGAMLESPEYTIQPLALAVQRKNPRLMKILLKTGAQVDYVHNGRKAIDYLEDTKDSISRQIRYLLNETDTTSLSTRGVPPDTDNAISYNTIQDGNIMANFHNEASFGRYYKKDSALGLLRPVQGRAPQNPFTKRPLKKSNITYYKASVKSTGGKRKTRKYKRT